VLENFVRSDTKGIVETGERLIRAAQTGAVHGQRTACGTATDAIGRDQAARPLRSAKCRSHCPLGRRRQRRPDSYAKAQSLLQNAEGIQFKDPRSKAVSTTARGSVQAAEDARLIALQRQEEARLEKERAEAAEREAQANAAAEQAAKQQAEAEEQSRLETE